MRRRAAFTRPAFTLLELVLATTIGVFILGGLYVAVRLHLRHAQVARDVVEQSTLARSLLDRMARDVRQNLGPIDPATISASSSASGGSTGSTSSTSGTSGTGSSSTSASTGSSTSGTSGSSSSTSGTSSSSSTSGSSTTTTSGVQFNVGIQGDSGRLVLCTNQVPRDAGADPAAAPNGDLRRITYWLMSGSQGGLARQELAQVTSDDAASDPPDDPALVIAAEVADLEFSYFDGTNWQDSWDGTTLGPDNQTPIGPPVAVAINLTLKTPGHKGTKTYRRVVLVQTANGIPLQTTTTTGQ
jgi:type II secretory pathway pseudopilin PulG